MPRSAGSWTTVALIVAGTFFMEYIDGTVIATALPEMARTFGTTPVALSIGMTAYLVTLAVFIPISGWVADRFGTRLIFGSAIGVFLAASVLCGLSEGLWQFAAARVLQGIGGAMMVPVGRLIVLRTTQKSDLVLAMAYLTWPALMAPIIGPAVGGFITTYWNWRWIFFLNLPIGAVAILLTLRLVPNLHSSTRRPFDGLGFLLSSGALASLMYGLEVSGREQADWGRVAAWLAAAVVLGAFTLRHVRRHPYPIVDLWPLRLQTFAAATWGGSIFRMTISSAPFLLPLMFQVGFGLSAFSSGLLVLMTFAGNLAMKVFTTPLMRAHGFRSVLVVNGVLTALSLATCALLVRATPFWISAAVLFFGGLCRSMQFTAISTLTYADVPAERMSGASSFGAMVMQLALGMGVAVGALALHLAMALHGTSGAPVVADFHLAFLLLAGLTAVGLASFLRMDRTAGAEVSGHMARASAHSAAK